MVTARPGACLYAPRSPPSASLTTPPMTAPSFTGCTRTTTRFRSPCPSANPRRPPGRRSHAHSHRQSPHHALRRAAAPHPGTRSSEQHADPATTHHTATCPHGRHSTTAHPPRARPPRSRPTKALGSDRDRRRSARRRAVERQGARHGRPCTPQRRVARGAPPCLGYSR